MSLVTPERSRIVETVAARVMALRIGHPLRVCVDGHSAAGKTTFTHELADALGERGRKCLRIEADDFHPERYLSHPARTGPPEQYLDQGYAWNVLLREVLEPAGSGGSRRCRRKYWDSYNDRFFDQDWVEITDDAVLLVDGGFPLVAPLREHWDFVVWLDSDWDTLVERATARDMAWSNDEAGVRAAYEQKWLPRHQHYVDVCRPLTLADVVIDNRDPQYPVLLEAGGRSIHI